jgi:hypothetical protein
MTRVVFGRTTAEVERKLTGEPRERLHTRGVIVGAPNEIVAQLGALAENTLDSLSTPQSQST